MSNEAKLIREILEDSFKAETRKNILDLQPHFVPIDLVSLKMSLGHILITNDKQLEEQGYGEIVNLSSLVNDIREFVKARHKVTLDVTRLPEDVVPNITKYTPAVVYENGEIIGVLYSSYNSSYDGLFKAFLRHRLKPSMFIEKRYTESGKKTSIGLDVGHIYSDGIADTPLHLKIVNLVDTINNLIGSPNRIDSKNINAARKVQTSLMKSLSLLESKSSYGRRIKTTLSKNVNQFLTSVSANVVIIQDRLENQVNFGTLVEGAISSEITGLLKTVHFSRSIDEEILHKVANSLLGKVDTTSYRPSKKLEDIILKPKTKLKVASSKKRSDILAKPRAIVGAQTNLISLQLLLNTHLQDVISANMGNGNDRKVLNYRTGRFAASAKVERLSESRAGMITAFYTYMKNPYQTFEPGYRQGSPKSRDPKALIGKSIKEIAATQVGNRMRAVLV